MSRYAFARDAIVRPPQESGNLLARLLDVQPLIYPWSAVRDFSICDTLFLGSVAQLRMTERKDTEESKRSVDMPAMEANLEQHVFDTRNQ